MPSLVPEIECQALPSQIRLDSLAVLPTLVDAFNFARLNYRASSQKLSYTCLKGFDAALEKEGIPDYRAFIYTTWILSVSPPASLPLSN